MPPRERSLAPRAIAVASSGRGAHCALTFHDVTVAAWMKTYNIAGYAIILLYTVGCLAAAPPHLGPWATLTIGAAYFIGESSSSWVARRG